ncbi:MAG: hypothetical protein IKQ69_06320 [Oscillospiraceae bacterium]|nr:hypothetical protein [Oscillospiraceae bacterium]
MMRFLFCGSSDVHNSRPAEEVFLIQKTPESMTDGLEKAEEEYERIQRKHSFPLALMLLRLLLLILWALIALRILKLEISYHNQPFLYWVGGCCLLAAGVLYLVEKYLERRKRNSESVRTGLTQVNVAEKSIRDYLAVPGSAVKTDILAFSYRGSEAHPKLRGAALNCEVSLFKQNEDICLFDGSNVFSFPQSELTGIRLVNQGIPVLYWNKKDAPSQKRFQKCGVMPRGNEIIGLRFFCALDISRSGDTYSLLFPAYELPAVAELTGLSAPELPPVTIAARVRQKKPKVKQLRHDGKVRPLFYWKPPKEDVGFWFSPMSDVEFQSEHPVLYTVLCILGITVLLLPAILFCIPAFKIPGVEHNGWLFLGAAGGFVVGVGLFNIVAAWLHQYLGHVMTIICFLAGGVMMAISWFLIR